MALQIRRGTEAQRTFVPLLAEPIFVTDTQRLFIGDGTTSGGVVPKCAPIGAASGDLGGNYPSPTVGGLHGKAVELGTPSDGDALVYESGAARWAHKPAGINTIPVESGTPTDGDALIYESGASRWAHKPAGLAGIAVESGTPSDADTLVYETTNARWAHKPSNIAGFAVESGTPANNDALVYSTANVRWEHKHPVLASTESFITADVGLNNATWVTVTSVSLAAGTWLVTGNLTASGTMDYNAGWIRLYDGTDTVASGAFTGIIDYVCGTHITAIVTLAATTTISLEGHAHDMGMTAVRRVYPGILKATGITAVRIA
jgi:hypothetical protein